MRTIIAGSRGAIYEDVAEAIHVASWHITEIVCGGAKGADAHGRFWAEGNNIPVKMFLADWDTHGKKAGYLRNEQMAQYAEALIAVWDGESKGTKHMIDLALKHKLPYTLVCTYET